MSVVSGAKLSEKTLYNVHDQYQSLGKYLTNACKDHPDTIFMVDAETEECITCQDVLDKSYRIAKWLANCGCVPGSVVGIVCENSFEYPALLLAVSNLGAICTCINPLYSKNEFLHAFNVSKTSIILTSSKLIEKISNVCVNCNFIKEIINIDEVSYPDCDSDFKSKLDETNPTSSNAIILYSSGTTSLSKGVMQSHKSWILIMEIFNASVNNIVLVGSADCIHQNCLGVCYRKSCIIHSLTIPSANTIRKRAINMQYGLRKKPYIYLKVHCELSKNSPNLNYNFVEIAYKIRG